MSAKLVASRPDTHWGPRGKENAPVPTESVASTRPGACCGAVRVGPRARPGPGRRSFVGRRWRRRRRHCGPHGWLRRRPDDGRRSERWLLDYHRGRCGHTARRGAGTGIPRPVGVAAGKAHRGHGTHAGRRRLLARGLRRRHLQLRRRGVLRLRRVHPSQPADRRYGADPRRRRLLARGLRRRHLQLRRRGLLRLHGVHPPQPAHRRYGVHRRRGGLLARGLRRRHFQLRRRRVLRLHGVHPPQPAHRGRGAHRRRRRLLVGRRRRWGLHLR